MTHDELLERIENFPINFSIDEEGNAVYMYGTNPTKRALRAAVELHHEHTSGSGDVYCYNCQQKYPCLTIQAIEKELP